MDPSSSDATSNNPSPEGSPSGASTGPPPLPHEGPLPHGEAEATPGRDTGDAQLEISRLREQLEEAESERDRRDRDAKELEAQQKALQAQQGELKAQQKAIVDELDAARAELSDLRAKLEKTTRDLADQQKELEDTIVQKDEINTHRSGLQIDLDRAQATLSERDQELASERERATAAQEAQMAAQKEVGETLQKLQEALRRIEGLQAELVSQHEKAEALLFVLRRITQHRWYRWWDRIRKILGRPALHGDRGDPLGIQSGMPM